MLDHGKQRVNQVYITFSGASDALAPCLVPQPAHYYHRHLPRARPRESHVCKAWLTAWAEQH